MPKADPHRSFITAWREYGEAWLTKDVDLYGPEDAWFKVCKSRRYWSDESLPPEKPAAPRQAPYRPPKKKRARSKPTIVTVRVLTAIGRDIVEWGAWATKDDSAPARHREREKEFREKMERELEEYKEWLTV